MRWICFLNFIQVFFVFRLFWKRTKILTHFDFFNDAVDKKVADGSVPFQWKSEHFKNNKWVFQRMNSLPVTKCKLIFFPYTKMSALPVGMRYGNNFTTSMCRLKVNWIKYNLLKRSESKRKELLASDKCVSVCRIFCFFPMKIRLPAVLIQLLKLLHASEESGKSKLKLICVPLKTFFLLQ